MDETALLVCGRHGVQLYQHSMRSSPHMASNSRKHTKTLLGHFSSLRAHFLQRCTGSATAVLGAPSAEHAFRSVTGAGVMVQPSAAPRQTQPVTGKQPWCLLCQHRPATTHTAATSQQSIEGLPSCPHAFRCSLPLARGLPEPDLTARWLCPASEGHSCASHS